MPLSGPGSRGSGPTPACPTGLGRYHPGMGRRPKAWGPPIHGLLVIDKPLHVGSTQVVSRVRHAAQGCRTGHAGTLDPLATGVLVCCLGRGTKAVEIIMGMSKTYRAGIDLSAFTSTDDAEGERQAVAVPSPPDREAIETVLPRFVGEIEQLPPVYSALKVDGKPAYARVRRGETVALQPRRVRIDAIAVVSYVWPLLVVEVRCGRGTYIRSLARDLGRALGTGGSLASLCRTAVGPYRVEDALAFDALPERLTQEALLPIPSAGPPAAPGSGS